MPVTPGCQGQAPVTHPPTVRTCLQQATNQNSVGFEEKQLNRLVADRIRSEGLWGGGGSV